MNNREPPNRQTFVLTLTFDRDAKTPDPVWVQRTIEREATLALQAESVKGFWLRVRSLRHEDVGGSAR